MNTRCHAECSVLSDELKDNSSLIIHHSQLITRRSRLAQGDSAMSKGFMYILECADGSYYTGSTKNIDLRLAQHQAGEGANHTKKRLPVKLVYIEEYPRIDEAFAREKQVQGWSRKKKEALIKGDFVGLSHLSVAYRDKSDFSPSRTSGPENHLEASFPKSLSSTSHQPLPDHQPLPEALEGNMDEQLKEIQR